MKSLILAAGRGRRLLPFTTNLPKCLLSIGRHTILSRQLDCLARLGVEEIVLICGFGADYVKNYVADLSTTPRVRTVFNPHYAVSENLLSLWSARAEMDEPFLLFNGDGVFHPTIMQLVLQSPESCCLMIDQKKSYNDDDMKVQLRGNRITRISKSLPSAGTHATSVGAMRFDEAAAANLREILCEIVQESTSTDSHFPRGIQRLIDHGFPVSGRIVNGLPWADVDTPTDLLNVQRNTQLFEAHVEAVGLPVNAAVLGNP